jgi:hypothetical protein
MLIRIQILVSFYFSALAVFVMVIWGYLTKTLPLGLLQPTDQYAAQLLTGLFKRGKHPNSVEFSLSTQTPKQQSRSHVLVKFIKMLSDQQLITGLSILIAALSSHCVLSRFEWRIVTSLAYFSATTHSLSLDVLRDYLAQHIWVRYCRVAFTLVFLILFSFAFIVDYAGMRLFNGPVHCVLVHWRSNSGFLSDSLTVGLFIVPVLIILWGKHISAVIRLAVQDASSYRHATTMMTNRISVHFWSWSNNLTILESAKLVADAQLHYDTNNSPSNSKTRISIWYFLEQYYEAYLSELPVWAFQFVYGTTKTTEAVWGTSSYVSMGDEAFGFGQVVAIGLLVLPLLALIEFINGKHCLYSHDRSADKLKSKACGIVHTLYVTMHICTAQMSQLNHLQVIPHPNHGLNRRTWNKVVVRTSPEALRNNYHPE